MHFTIMKLGEYLREQSITDSAFAAKIGRNPTTVGRIRKGEVLPDWQTVARIHETTNGAVTANDFVPAIAPSPAPEQERIAS